MPLIARGSGQGAQAYGLLVSMISAGALAGLVAQRYLRRVVDLDGMVMIGSIGAAAALGLFGGTHAFPLLAGACVCSGAAWVLVLTSLYVSAQNVLPQWVRGRGLAIFLTVIFGAVAVCSAAPTMPASLRSSAATIGVRRWRRSRNLSALRLTPPPITNRSGQR